MCRSEIFKNVYESFVDSVVHTWWRFQAWRRSRNPELVELDAFRELVDVERRLQKYPRAVPVLEAALKLYETTGQDDKKRDIARRLREATAASRCPESEESPTVAVSPEMEALAARALEHVRNGGRASVSHFQRTLGICYEQAVQVYELLERRGLIRVNE